MLLEGFKLMGVGMATVMLFLILMILCINWVKNVNRNFTELEESSLKENQKSKTNNPKSEKLTALPIKVFAAAISAFESETKINKKTI